MGVQTDLAFQKEDDVIPPALRLVRDFVNTVEYQVDDERLNEPSDLSEWLVERQLLRSAVTVTVEDLDFAKTLREGLRGVLELHAGHDADASAIRRLNEALEELPVRVSFGETETFGLVPASADPIREALGGMLDAVRQSSEDGTWARLKACARDSCRWAYYDHSRNRSSRWCTMAGCGNAVKMKKAYAARKARPHATT
ncbi:CGNR zinc finger domain-containing protein [Agromyces ramosus]|uniref:RNA-binding Zn ribbon-like protein n=1 Tax=Agromyces ramosus TaxID=33879 RepID=A0ABU0R787_9MICO|nr:CGNR zinc finger domain-containing protein [Agromyces ramosus]MDQ0893944.1 putative RNA-binding Zn ribbon-like protein [Agromyces ramosus]